MYTSRLARLIGRSHTQRLEGMSDKDLTAEDAPSNTEGSTEHDAHNSQLSTEPMLELVVELGDALNRSSYPTSRTRDVLIDVTRAHKDDITVEVFPTLVFGVDRKRNQMSVSQTGGAFRFDQMVETQTLIQQLKRTEVIPEEALTDLRQISSSKPPFPAWIRILGYALQTLAFAQMFRMGTQPTLLATALGLIVGATLILSNVKGTFAALMPVLMTFVSALAIGLFALAGDNADPVRTAAVPVLILLPGAALTCALIELATGDMIAGSSRLVYAIFILISMAFGFALAVSIAHVPSDMLQDLPNTETAWYWPWVAVPIFAIGNVMYFCTPRKLWGMLIAVAFLTYCTQQLMQLIVDPAIAGGVAAGVALLLAMFFNSESHAGPSSMVLFLPTFWMLVPGSMGFVALSGVITENRSLSSMGIQAVVSLLSMAVGIMVASMAAPFFAPDHKKVQAYLKPSAIKSATAAATETVTKTAKKKQKHKRSKP